MSFEMLVLALTTLLVLLAWLPLFAAKIRVSGWKMLESGSFFFESENLSGWGVGSLEAWRSLNRCYPPFAVAVLLLAFTGGFTPATALTATIFLAARLIHLPATIFGLHSLRLLTASLAWLATVYLLGVAMLALLAF